MKNLHLTLLAIFIIAIRTSNCQEYCLENILYSQKDSFDQDLFTNCTGESRSVIITPNCNYNTIIFYFESINFYNDGDNIYVYEYNPNFPNWPGALITSFDIYSGEYAYIKFSSRNKGLWFMYNRSDINNLNSGFIFKYEAVNVINQTFSYTAKNKSIDDGSGASNYALNIVNKYVIKPTDADFVELIFSDYSINYGDYVSVYDGSSETASLLGTYSYPTMPSKKFRSTGPAMCLLFGSDNAYNGAGWTAEYQGLYNQNNQLEFPKYDASGNLEDRIIVLGTRTKSANIQYSKQETQPQKEYTETIENNNIHIYPNPTQGQIKVEIKGYDLSLKNFINIYSLTGNLIKQISPVTESNNIDMSGYSDGMYIMRINIANKVSEWKVKKE